MSSTPVGTDLPQNPLDLELTALSTISSLLADLPQDSQIRIVNWISSRFHVQGATLSASKRNASSESQNVVMEFADLASLFVAANPTTGAEKALVVAFWLQESMHHEEWEGFAINTELKHLGHGLKNVTDALNALIEQRPQLVVQLRKSGKTKQARKQYKLTAEGIRKVRQIVSLANKI
jgi:hypothetical protein